MDLRGRAVVITGASSGLGRAAALEIARRGANVVLAARRKDALDDTAERCRAEGVAAIVVPTDVTREEDVARLTSTALEELGAIDAWINNAGVTLYAQLEEGALDEHRRVIETNLIGAVICARAVMPVFRAAHRGVLVNIGSVLSHVGQAFVPAYSISKFGVRGLTEALRIEIADEPDIHVCSVFPYAIDTQHFEVAASRIGRAPFALPPVQSPEKVAIAIADVCERPRRTRYVPRSIALGVAMHAIAPRITERLLLDALRRWHLSDRKQAIGPGNLYTPPRTPPAMTHGTRPPMISAPRLALWLGGQLIKHGGEALRRRMQFLAARRGPATEPELPVPRPRRAARGTTAPATKRPGPSFASRLARGIARYQVAIGIAAIGFAARALARHTQHADPRIRVAARATRWMIERRDRGLAAGRA